VKYPRPQASTSDSEGAGACWAVGLWCVGQTARGAKAAEHLCVRGGEPTGRMPAVSAALWSSPTRSSYLFGFFWWASVSAARRFSAWATVLSVGESTARSRSPSLAEWAPVSRSCDSLPPVPPACPNPQHPAQGGQLGRRTGGLRPAASPERPMPRFLRIPLSSRRPPSSGESVTTLPDDPAE
jgi:hypothetical protein